MLLATKTLAAIDTGLEADQGGKYREFLGKVIPHMGDAYRGTDDGFRSHLGASMVGRACARDIWYGFRWARKPKFPARILRLFNRGHLEEARFIALLLSIGVQVFQQDSNGNQFRISDCGGHFGGSGDGVGIGIPDLPAGSPCLLEFKTHSLKSFEKLQKVGVKEAKPEHYVQMQTYMRKMGIGAALYGAVNKNDDALHLEIIFLDPVYADQFLERGRTIIMMREAPKRINESPGWFECRFCDNKLLCHGNEDPAVNCRTCHHVRVDVDNGGWICGQTGEVLSKEQQLAACKEYTPFRV